MAPKSIKTVYLISPKKALFFCGIILIVVLCGGMLGGELYLRYRQKMIARSNKIEEGMVAYDPSLGWRLVPGWSGRHTHYDFNVQYTINPYGFRGKFNLKKNRTGRRYAVVGDSFTFSFGVSDNETFVDILNRQSTSTDTFLNFGVPGFSTDQEFLLIKEQVFYFEPQVIIVVVYLGNDLFDNQRPFPLQADNAKPYFELASDGLRLKNAPVPRRAKPQSESQKDLMTIVLGEDFESDNLIDRFMPRWILMRLIREMVFSGSKKIQFGDRLTPALRLFNAIIAEMHRLCLEKHIELKLILMPGKSFIERPGSISEQFQNHLRKMIWENRRSMNIEVIDLAKIMRTRYQKESRKWFYPHEGHLNPAGHRVVADILASALKQK